MTQKTVLITGASKGIGLATAQEFLRHGYKVIATATSHESFREFPILNSENVEFMALDFSDLDQLQVVADKITVEYEHIDVMINNAGIYLEKLFKETGFEEMQRVMQVNTLAPMEFTRKLLPLLSRKHGSQIINLSSRGALHPKEFHTIYSASKTAISAFSESLRMECNKIGIKVTVLHPGDVNTWNDPLPQKMLKPEDVAQLCRFIVEADARCQIEDVRLSSL